MGIRLVQYANGPWWAHLDPAPRMVLSIMASKVLDAPKGKTPAGTYFASRAELVLAYAGVDENDPRWDSVERRIRRHLSTLVDAGAIRLIYRGHQGKNSVYELLVDPLRDCQDELPSD